MAALQALADNQHDVFNLRCVKIKRGIRPLRLVVATLDALQIGKEICIAEIIFYDERELKRSVYAERRAITLAAACDFGRRKNAKNDHTNRIDHAKCGSQPRAARAFFKLQRDKRRGRECEQRADHARAEKLRGEFLTFVRVGVDYRIERDDVKSGVEKNDQKERDSRTKRIDRQRKQSGKPENLLKTTKQR